MSSVWVNGASAGGSAPRRTATIPSEGTTATNFVGHTAFGADLRGRDAFLAWFRAAAERLPGLTFEVRDVVVGGWPWNTRVAVRLAISAPLPDGTTYGNEGVQWLRRRWGRMVDDWVLEDTIALQQALDQTARVA